MNLFILIFFNALVISLIFVSPAVLLLLVIVNFAMAFGQGLLQIFSSLLPLKQPRTRAAEKKGLVSFHIASHSEPPEILIRTLEALGNINYPRTEVLVLDNNTQDEKLWKPVQESCRRLGPKFKFFHESRLSGYKAGALNYLRRKTNPKAEYIVVVDADYIVNPNFLNEALKYFHDDTVAFAQFPQAYENVGPGNIGMVLEYEHFFATYMKMANYFGCANTTGTLTVFRSKALRRVGAYDTDFITEDAEMGTRLITRNYRSVYVDKVMGRGLAPFELDSYKKQKFRWAMGNIQVLRHYLLKLLFKRGVGLPQKIGLIAQLTAWLNYTLLPIMVILLVSISSLFRPASPTLLLAFGLAGNTLALFVLQKLFSFFLVFSGKYSVSTILRALLVHLGMNWVYSSAIFIGLFKKRHVFFRTNKFIFSGVGRGLQLVAIETFLLLLSLVTAGALLATGHAASAAPVLLVGFLNLLVFYVRWEAGEAKKLSTMLLSELK